MDFFFYGYSESIPFALAVWVQHVSFLHPFRAYNDTSVPTILAVESSSRSGKSQRSEFCVQGSVCFRSDIYSSREERKYSLKA